MGAPGCTVCGTVPAFPGRCGRCVDHCDCPFEWKAGGEPAHEASDNRGEQVETPARAASRSVRREAAYRGALVGLSNVMREVLLRAPGYDWNADPERLTLKTGRALREADVALGYVE